MSNHFFAKYIENNHYKLYNDDGTFRFLKTMQTIKNWENFIPTQTQMLMCRIKSTGVSENRIQFNKQQFIVTDRM